MKRVFQVISSILLAPVAITAQAHAQNAPTSILPPTVAPAVPAPVVPVPPPVIEPVYPEWSAANATALLASIDAVGTLGLKPADYEADALRTALGEGEGAALDKLASLLFTRLATDIRDGRTPKAARVGWLIRDSDADTMAIDPLMNAALETGTVASALAGLEPKHADYAALKAALALSKDPARTKLIRANMDRWRWLPQSLGERHLLANVPEYMLRVNIHGRNIAAYRVIVGKLNTKTPQLATPATGIVVHPPWTLPRSIITEEVGPLIARNPAAARARGYTWTGSGKNLSVVQQPGPTAALGLLKIDMPNAEAIFIHDTPNRGLFASHPRAFSHGCLRTERAFELGILLGILQSGHSLDDAEARERIANELVTLIKAGKTAKIPFKQTIPVYIGYFTLARDGAGKLASYVDVYGRDAPVIASFDKPRVTPVSVPVAPTIVASDGSR